MKRTTKPGNDSTWPYPALSRQALLLWLLAGVVVALGALVACQNPPIPTSSLPAPPVPAEEVDQALLALPDGPELHVLILWLDEVERYFEGIECWLLTPLPREDTSCAFE